MGVAVPRAPVGTWGPEPLKSSVTGPSLLVNCYLEIKFYKKKSGCFIAKCTGQCLVHRQMYWSVFGTSPNVQASVWHIAKCTGQCLAHRQMYKLVFGTSPNVLPSVWHIAKCTGQCLAVGTSPNVQASVWHFAKCFPVCTDIFILVTTYY